MSLISYSPISPPQFRQHSAKCVIKESRDSKAVTQILQDVWTGQFKGFTAEQAGWEKNRPRLTVTWGSRRSPAHTGNYNYVN